MTIPDGYTDTAIMGNLVVEFRPLVKLQREELLLRVSGLGDEHADQVMWNVLAGQITYPVRTSSFWTQWAVRHDAHGDLARLVMGDPKRQQAEADNLRQSVLLVARYPHLLDVTCEQCRAWWYDPYDGTTAKRCGQPLRRPPGNPLPCDTTVGCPKGHHSRPVAPLRKNVLAWKHYRHCEAVGQFPSDLIVARNAEIIRGALREGVAC